MTKRRIDVLVAKHNTQLEGEEGGQRRMQRRSGVEPRVVTVVFACVSISISVAERVAH